MKNIIILTLILPFVLFFLLINVSFSSYLYEGEDTANLTLEVVEPITFDFSSMVLDFGTHTSSGNLEILESNVIDVSITGSYNDGNSLNIYFDNDLLEKTISLANGQESIMTTIKMNIVKNLDDSNIAKIQVQGEIAIGEIKDKASGDYSGVITLYAEYN